MTIKVVLTNILFFLEKLEKDRISEREITIAEGFINLGNLCIASFLFGQMLGSEINYYLLGFGSLAGAFLYAGAILVMRRRK